MYWWVGEEKRSVERLEKEISELERRKRSGKRTLMMMTTPMNRQRRQIRCPSSSFQRKSSAGGRKPERKQHQAEEPWRGQQEHVGSSRSKG